MKRETEKVATGVIMIRTPKKIFDSDVGLFRESGTVCGVKGKCFQEI
jgi:hypothetical protein